MKDLKKEIEERIILLMARERLTANDVIKNLMPMIETLLLSERKKILEEVWEEYVERCNKCNGEGWWSCEEDGELLSFDCKECNKKGFFFNAWKFDEDIKKVRELSKITKRGK